MAYTEAQIRNLYTKPAHVVEYHTFELYNPKAGYARVLAGGPNGPYRSMDFLTEQGTMETFRIARVEMPDTTTQDVNSTELGQINLSRVGYAMMEYLEPIQQFGVKPSDAVITCRIATYINPNSKPIYSQNVYVAENGISLDAENVTLKLQFENPAKIAISKYYDPIKEYTGLIYL